MLLCKHVNAGKVPDVNTVMPAVLQTSKLHSLRHDRARLYFSSYTAQDIHQIGNG